jgi:amino acid permease
MDHSGTAVGRANGISVCGMSGVRIRPLTVLLLVLVVLLVGVGIVYFTRTAADLPSFFPGHAARSTKHHVKHGIAVLGVAVVVLIAAWFTTAPTSGSQKN